jgi:ribosomal protein RSM22 (predicted rRNA methylase)
MLGPMPELPQHVPALLERARALLGLAGGPPAALAPAELRRAARAVEALHEGLVAGRVLARPATYDDPVHLGAYLLWWWPQTYAKVRALLEMARAAGALPEHAARMVDLGSGPGGAAVAALDALGGEALAVDASAAALAEARFLGAGRLATRHADLASPSFELDGEFDLALLANLLSELPPTAREPLVARLPLARDGAVLIVEPALRETGRALLEVRDALLRRGWAAAGPCLTQRPCPALSNPRDWCTAQQTWEPPEHLVQLARELGLRSDEELAYAPLILVRRIEPATAGTWRVVGVPQPEKGKKRLFVCSDEGRVALTRLDRDAGPANEDFDRLQRGDLVQLRGVEPKGDGLRIGAGSELRRLEQVPRGERG